MTHPCAPNCTWRLVDDHDAALTRGSAATMYTSGRPPSSAERLARSMRGRRRQAMIEQRRHENDKAADVDAMMALAHRLTPVMRRHRLNGEVQPSGRDAIVWCSSPRSGTHDPADDCLDVWLHIDWLNRSVSMNFCGVSMHDGPDVNLDVAELLDAAPAVSALLDDFLAVELAIPPDSPRS